MFYRGQNEYGIHSTATVSDTNFPLYNIKGQD